MGRENELYRDKIEVSLDGRQIFSLFFAGAVIVCTVFVIGVIVGKRVEARAHVDGAGSAAAGDPLAALDRLEADTPLSFRRTLRGGQAASGTVDAEIAAMASAQQAAQGEPGKGSAAHAADAADKGKLERKVDGKDDERAEALPVAKGEEKPEKGKVDGKLDAKAEAKPEKADEKADAKGEGKPEVDIKTDASGKAGKAGKAKYTLQLSSFQERGEAETFLSELRAAGYTASVVAAEIEGKGTFYRVRLGTYPSFDDAVKAKAEFERKVSKIAYVTKL
jgi:cell division septation protein DedD